jgi:hypothetical protein
MDTSSNNPKPIQRIASKVVRNRDVAQRIWAVKMKVVIHQQQN